MRLVDALEHEREQALGLAHDLSSPPHVPRGDPADLGDAFWRVRGDRSLERLEPDRVHVEELSVEAVDLDQLLRESVQDRQVCPGLDGEVHLGFARRLRLARVDHDRPRRVGAAQPVELVHP
jgi:hypothetical protein